MRDKRLLINEQRSFSQIAETVDSNPIHKQGWRIGVRGWDGTMALEDRQSVSSAVHPI